MFYFDGELLQIILLSVSISGAAAALAALLAGPVALYFSLNEFKTKRVLVRIINSLMACPSVLIGLLLYLLLSRRGLFGFLGLLYTPGAMLLAQAALALPIITALSFSALKPGAKNLYELARALGAGRFQALVKVLLEQKAGLLTAFITGFSRVLAETGMTLMVGGNLKGSTRVMTTTITLETMKGNFETAIALGLVMLFVAVLINLVLQVLADK